MFVIHVVGVVEVPRSMPARITATLYREAQCEMFRAARDAGFDTRDRSGMIAVTNRLLGTSITSRTQLTYAQVREVTRAFETLSAWRRA